MLSNKEFLLLCQTASIGALTTTKTSICEIAKLLISTDRCDNIPLLEEVAACKNFESLKLKCSKKSDEVNIFILEDISCNDFVVFVGKESLNCSKYETIEEIYDFVKQNIQNNICSITGLKTGGIYAAYTASQLDVEAFLFGAPTIEELPGNVTNFVAENEPVGAFLEKVVFAKQKTLSENTNETYYEMLMFNESGKVIEGEQTEYSKFCSWFINNAGNIDNTVWEMFFKYKSEDDSLINKDIYSLYFRVSELTEDRVKNALKNVIKLMENELEKNITPLKLEIQKDISDIDAQAFFESICEKAEKTTQTAVDIINGIYRSVEIILLGTEVFLLGNNALDTLPLMEQWKKDTDIILDTQELSIADLLKTGRERYIEMLSAFPDIYLEDDENHEF